MARLTPESEESLVLRRLGTSKLLRMMYRRAPRLQPVMRELYGFITRRPPPHFFGWLMATDHEHPWVDAHRWGSFRRAAESIKDFELTDPSRRETLDALKWRHWIVAYAAAHAALHARSDRFSAIECGVEDGLTAFFALDQLAEAQANGLISSFTMHLYDAWGEMDSQQLTTSEVSVNSRFSNLDIDRTRRNLRSFQGKVVFHKGRLPGLLTDFRPPEKPIGYLHVDLNAARPTAQVCELLWPDISAGGVILFDDYGWRAYAETKLLVDQFFSDKPGTLFKLPTGQAIYFR